jgi:hypothetical protein
LCPRSSRTGGARRLRARKPLIFPRLGLNSAKVEPKTSLLKIRPVFKDILICLIFFRPLEVKCSLFFTISKHLSQSKKSSSFVPLKGYLLKKGIIKFEILFWSDTEYSRYSRLRRLATPP